MHIKCFPLEPASLPMQLTSVKILNGTNYEDGKESLDLYLAITNHGIYIWDLVELPKGCKPVGCKWVFKTKRSSDGAVERYKARLVAKGYSQREGIDYKETFSPVSTKDSFRVVMALVAHFNLELHQMDVKTDFLNGDLTEDVYMIQPDGFVEKGRERLI